MARLRWRIGEQRPAVIRRGVACRGLPFVGLIDRSQSSLRCSTLSLRERGDPCLVEIAGAMQGQLPAGCLEAPVRHRILEEVIGTADAFSDHLAGLFWMGVFPPGGDGSVEPGLVVGELDAGVNAESGALVELLI